MIMDGKDPHIWQIIYIGLELTSIWMIQAHYHSTLDLSS